ncbi:TOBE domain-containing protein [Paenibacillus sp. MAH-36]|uniref:TOBE domain-containing protein n=1 Tax=Paenibacillus violae TaxID=3077234 RepID=A0ABU3RPZ8_9BACL|nr:TOBE domain-containing protein [Paenibacillus sp. PFR10]MDU0206368.1 TOBE domain-containing protein [Paenibacillus sp. PFR10]
MDEPLSSLDAGLRDEMRVELVRIFKQLGMTVVYVTHDQMEAMSMADQIVILKDGRCEQQGIPETLYNEPVSEYVAKFMGSANILRGDMHIGSLFIRPEDVQIVLGMEEMAVPIEMEELSGTVVLASYQGQKYRYFVDIPMYERPIEVTHNEKIKVGESVRLWIPIHKWREIQSV